MLSKYYPKKIKTPFIML